MTRLRALRLFARDAAGVAATELALVAPALLALYVGVVDLGEAMAVQYKTQIVARNVADVASQYARIDNATMSVILHASAAIVAPFPASGMTVTVSEVTTDASGAGVIAWSDALNGTPPLVGSPVALPAAMRLPNVAVIWAHVTYPYRPSVGPAPIGIITIARDAWFFPRLAASIVRTAT